VVAPSENKFWIRKPWEQGDILPVIPDDLLLAVAIPMYIPVNATLQLPDGCIELTGNDTGNAVIHKFQLLRVLMSQGEQQGTSSTERIILPIEFGSVDLMKTLLYVCEHRVYPAWLIDICEPEKLPDYFRELQKLADYLCCDKVITRLLSTNNPTSPTTWFYSIYKTDPNWAIDTLVDTLVELTTTEGVEILYKPLRKSDEWLFPVTKTIGIEEGTSMVIKTKEVLQNCIETEIPEIVQRIMSKHPKLVLAGSSMLHLVCQSVLSKASDYDLYACDVTFPEFEAIINDIREMSDIMISKQTGAALTLIFSNTIVIQVILKKFRDISHILDSFDLAPCKIALSNGRIFVARTWIHAIKHMSFYVNFHRWNNASVSRIFKYYSKGFEVLVPGMQRSVFQYNLKRDVGVCNLIAVEQSFRGLTMYRKPRNKRFESKLVEQQVRSNNYWGNRHQSGYSEYIGISIPYVICSMISKGMSWLGLRPIQFGGTKDITITEAGSGAFHSSPPNFPALYEMDDIQDNDES
jgi:hypothetical protein